MASAVEQNAKWHLFQGEVRQGDDWKSVSFFSIRSLSYLLLRSSRDCKSSRILRSHSGIIHYILINNNNLENVDKLLKIIRLALFLL